MRKRTHLHLTKLSYLNRKNGKQSSVIWKKGCPSGALIFVHGFGLSGRAISTWSMFDSMLPNDLRTNMYDIYFYEYDCFNSSTDAEGLSLLKFLNDIFSNPLLCLPKATIEHTKREHWTGYTKVVVASHSAGGVVCRKALLYAIDKKYKWMDKVLTAYYAPAYSGAPITHLLSRSTSFKDKLLGVIVESFSQIAKELTPGSGSLSELKNETERAIANGASFLKATKVILAQHDYVVLNQLYPCDRAGADNIAGANHFSVCKPSAECMDPYDYLVSIL